MVADIVENTMQTVFSTFADMLKCRSKDKQDVNLINEKTIVALLFNAAVNAEVKEKIPSHNINLEVPHSTLNEKQSYDMRICTHGNKKIAIECKYYKNIESPPKPLKAGKLFEDLRRLSAIHRKEKEATCYCVFIVSEQMADYFSKHHKDFFNLKENGEWKISKKYKKRQKKTFNDQINGSLECKITNVLDRSFDENGTKIYIKIFKVET